MLFASTAYACTVWAGVFKVQADETGFDTPSAPGPTRISTGQPTGCHALTGYPTGGMSQSISGDQVSTRRTLATPVGAVRLKVEAGTGCNKLPPGTYDINWYSGKGYTVNGGNYAWARDCMSPVMGLGVKIGEIAVNTAGSSVGNNTTTNPTVNGWWEFKISSPWANVGSEEGAICVSDAAGLYGNQAPVRVNV